MGLTFTAICGIIMSKGGSENILHGVQKTMDNKQNTQNTKAKTPFQQEISKVKRTFLILAAVSIVMVLLGAILGETGIGVILLALGLIVLCFSPFGYFMTIKQAKNGHCKHCGEKYDYDRDVSWVEEEQISKEESVVSVVRFSCHCANCGNVKEFTAKLTIASYNKQKNTWSRHNLENLCRKYFKPFKFFG